MKKHLSIEANAKINLFLDVISRRTDGFHDIKSVMQSVSLSDIVSVNIEKKETSRITLQVMGADLPCDEQNIAYRAAELYMAKTDNNFHVDIKIDKRIPIAAGLAGGSADGAAVLKLLDMASPEPIGEARLAEVGSALGSDVPFCVLGGTRLCTGRGEITIPYTVPLDMYYIVAIGGEAVSTPYAYSEIDRRFFSSGTNMSHHAEERFDMLEKGILAGDVKLISKGMYNLFEDIMTPQLPDATDLIKAMRSRGALAAIMSGSGPSVVGLFEDQAAALSAAMGLPGRVFVCQNTKKQFGR